MAKIASAIRNRETMVELRGYGFAPVATVLSFVADNCDRQENDRAAISCRRLNQTKFPKAAKTEPCDDVHQSERRRN
jgi:hypothetical protein